MEQSHDFLQVMLEMKAGLVLSVSKATGGGQWLSLSPYMCVGTDQE